MCLFEVDPKGEIVWTWHGSEHLDPNLDVICPLEGRQEWTHGNAVEETPDGQILLSFRQTSTVLTLDKASGKILWRYGPGSSLTSTTLPCWKTATSSSTTTASTVHAVDASRAPLR